MKAAGAIYGDRMETPTAYAMECAGDPRVAQQQIMELEGHVVGVVNNLLMDGFSDELLPGIIEAHHLPEGKLPVMVEEYFGTALDIVVFGRTLAHAGGRAPGPAIRQPGKPFAAQADAQAGLRGDTGAYAWGQGRVGGGSEGAQLDAGRAS